MKPLWNETDKMLYERLKNQKTLLQCMVDDVNLMVLKIEQKYQHSEKQEVINSGRY